MPSEGSVRTGCCHDYAPRRVRRADAVSKSRPRPKAGMDEPLWHSRALLTRHGIVTT